MRNILMTLIFGGLLLITACAEEGAERNAIDEPMQNAPAPGGDPLDETVQPSDTLNEGEDATYQ